MLYNETSLPLIVIVGPTAVGKTDFSLDLADMLNGEIISADSRLFYRGMDIGTAKPSLAERGKIPHFMIDIVDPDTTVGLSQYQTMVASMILDIHRRGHLPFLVGGTGQYIRAVVEGWKIPPQPPNPSLREVLNRWAVELGKIEIHKRLMLLDPDAATLIEPNNVRRTIRALEVIFSTGERFSVLRRKSSPPYPILTIGLTRPRSELYERVDRRITQMIQDGLVDEVKKLLDFGFSPELPAFSAIGYKEIVQFLQNKISLDEAVELIKRNTRIFVRRQANWFKENDPTIQWLKMDGNEIKKAHTLVQQFLKGIN